MLPVTIIQHNDEAAGNKVQCIQTAILAITNDGLFVQTNPTEIIEVKIPEIEHTEYNAKRNSFKIHSSRIGCVEIVPMLNEVKSLRVLLSNIGIHISDKTNSKE